MKTVISPIGEHIWSVEFLWGQKKVVAISIQSNIYLLLKS